MPPLSTYRAKVAASDAGLTRVPRYDTWALRDAGMRITRALSSITALCTVGFFGFYALTALWGAS